MSHPAVFIYTFSMGRWLYLERAIKSIARSKVAYKGPVKHFVFLQGVSLPPEYSYLSSHATFMQFEKNHGIADGINIAMQFVEDEIILKFDDDCIISSPHFFNHIGYISKTFPSLIYSPYPVGLINHPGGPSAIKHEMHYNERDDVYYTFRRVSHVGGLCRISPSATKHWKLTSDINIDGLSGNEDAQFTQLALANNIPMAYLENALIVEHQESTLGQHSRYGEQYFKGRF